MSEEQTNTEQSTENPEENKSYSKEQYDSLKSNLVAQLGELKGQLATFNTEREERAKADADAENQKLIENNEHKALLEKSQAEWNSERDELTKSIELMRSEKANLSFDNTLISHGITDEIQILGLKAKYSSTQDAPDFAEWLTAQDLAPKEVGRSSGAIPKVSTKATGSLEQRLNSTDPKVKRAALAEQLSQSMGIG